MAPVLCRCSAPAPPPRPPSRCGRAIALLHTRVNSGVACYRAGHPHPAAGRPAGPALALGADVARMRRGLAQPPLPAYPVYPAYAARGVVVGVEAGQGGVEVAADLGQGSPGRRLQGVGADTRVTTASPTPAAGTAVTSERADHRLGLGPGGHVDRVQGPDQGGERLHGRPDPQGPAASSTCRPRSPRPARCAASGCRAGPRVYHRLPEPGRWRRRSRRRPRPPWPARSSGPRPGWCPACGPSGRRHRGRGQPVGDHLEHPAEGVAGRLGRVDRGRHPSLGLPVQAADGLGGSTSSRMARDGCGGRVDHVACGGRSPRPGRAGPWRPPRRPPGPLSRALARSTPAGRRRSRTLRMPVRSAWPGGAGQPLALCRWLPPPGPRPVRGHHLGPLGPLAVVDLHGQGRPQGAPVALPSTSSRSCSKRTALAAAVAEPPPGQLVVIPALVR